MSITFFIIFRVFLRIKRQNRNFLPVIEAPFRAQNAKGDIHDQKELENHTFLGDFVGSGWAFGGFIDPKCHGALWANGSKATFVTTGLAISCGVDDPICIDGRWCRSGGLRAQWCVQKPGLKSYGGAVDRQFLLAVAVFLCPGLWFGAAVDHSAVGTGNLDDPRIPQGIATCGTAADPIYPLAPVCHLFECRSLAYKQINENIPFLFFFCVV